MLKVYTDRYPINGTAGETAQLPIDIKPMPQAYETSWRFSRGSHTPREIASYDEGKVRYAESRFGNRLRLHPQNSTLEIRNLQEEDGGTYHVELTVENYNYEIEMRLQVYEKLLGIEVQTECSENLSANESFTITLRCRVNNSDHVSYSWERGSEAVTEGETHHLSDSGRTLMMSLPAKQFKTAYHCRASNPTGFLKREVYLREACTAGSLTSTVMGILIVSFAVSVPF
nr:PREDICTED: CD48 antigen [Latimeria chalumnae]|eukprot:XP_006011698.1 PREDICTED: CD48 antigen [Latimeria chalumnae]